MDPAMATFNEAVAPGASIPKGRKVQGTIRYSMGLPNLAEQARGWLTWGQ